MKIVDIQVRSADAGWRPWTFIAVHTDEGIIGWSDCTDAHGSPRGVIAAVEDLKQLLIGKDPMHIESAYWLLYGRTRQSTGGVVQKAIGGIENALLDIKGKKFGVPVYQLLGGAVRTQIPAYWTRFGTSRLRDWKYLDAPRLQTFEDVKALGLEVRKSAFNTIKTNLLILDEEPRVYMPGFSKSEGWPSFDLSPKISQKIEKYVATLREAAGEDTVILLDMNYNFRTDGYIKLGRMLEKYQLGWVEIDSFDPKALRDIRFGLRTPVASLENAVGLRGYLPYFENHSVDYAIVDVVWNGVLQSRKIADTAEVYEMNVATHGHHSPLGSFIAAQFAAMTPNFKIMEIDGDDVAWRNTHFTAAPVIQDGMMQLPTEPGWGIEPAEKLFIDHPWPIVK